MTSTRRPLIAGNWKMHHNHFETIQVVQKLAYLLTKGDFDAVDVSVHPPGTDLRSAQTTLADQKASEIALGAQHCHWEDSGAYTGEISPAFLAKLDVRFVIVGHSERRQLFGETDDDVNRKVHAVLRHAMTPILCVGETLEEREAGITETRVMSQVRAGLAGVAPEQVAATVVAYEPIWAIGTGRTAAPADAQTVCALVRSTAGAIAGPEAAAAVRVLYGGSVKAANIAELMAEADIDGALVGGASLDPDEFVRIVRYREQA
ncbi:MAG: triose-phosphate isomerase [Acidimicrobiia bacterium]